MNTTAESPIDTWMGWSRGRWEGDTLVVDVTAFNGESWFDRAGNFQTNTLHVVERYSPIGKDALRYEATIEDPQIYTRPWKISMPLYRRLESDAQLVEYKCVEFAEELMYGHLVKQPKPIRLNERREVVESRNRFIASIGCVRSIGGRGRVWRRCARRTHADTSREPMDAAANALGRPRSPGPVEQPDVDAARAAAERRPGRQGDASREEEAETFERTERQSFDEAPQDRRSRHLQRVLARRREGA